MPFFISKLKEEGRLNQTHFTIVNVGSRKITSQDDYAEGGWGVLAPNLTIYGFDADADACDAANADLEARQINWVEKHIPLALGETVGEATLYVTQDPMCSSLYQPNEPYAARFSGLSELMNESFSIEVDITTLDQVCQTEGIHEIDFLQVDVQGADLQVLKGASQTLDRTILAVQIEVEFSHLYRHQPLFADVDTFLRGRSSLYLILVLPIVYGPIAHSIIPTIGTTALGRRYLFPRFHPRRIQFPIENPRANFETGLYRRHPGIS